MLCLNFERNYLRQKEYNRYLKKTSPGRYHPVVGVKFQDKESYRKQETSESTFRRVT